MKNFEDLLEHHLQASADSVPSRQGDVQSIMTRGRRRQTTRRVAVAVSAAAVVVLGIGITASLLTGTADDLNVVDGSTTTVPGETTAPSTTQPPAASSTTIEDAIIIPTDSGLLITNGSEQIQIPGDRYYERIRSVVSDGRGGLLMVHEVAPLPWSMGSVVWLPAGAEQPQVLVSGPDNPVTDRALLGLTEDGFLYADRTSVAGGTTLEVYAAGFDGAQPSLLLSEPAAGWDTPLGDVAGSGDRLALVRNTDCPTIDVFDARGERITSLFEDCPFGLIYDIAVSPLDEGRLLVLATLGTPDASTVAQVDILTGEVLHEVAAEVWAIGWRSVDEAIVVGSSGVGLLDLDSGELDIIDIASPGLAVGASAVTVADGAGTGSGSGELPCEPIETPVVTMDAVPEDVLAKWQLLRELAASCEFVSLSEIAATDGTAFTFGGETDLASVWVRAGRYGYSYRDQLLTLTALPPATLDTEGGTIWVWPAVAATGSDEDWQVLVDAGFMTTEDAEAMRSEVGYLDFRVGIRDNGTWVFAVAGD